MSNILYEDEFFCALNKPPKIPVHKTLDPEREHLLSNFENSNKDYFLINRLDKDTSGVVLIAKTNFVATKLSQLFYDRKIDKKYFAVVEGAIDFNEKIIVNHLAPVKGLKNIYGSVKSGGKRAETKLKKISTSRDFSLIMAIPTTGRTHQIRVHLAELGYPIAGDINYGAQFRHQIRRVMLHAYSLSFKHPFSKEFVTITSQVPEDFHNTLEFLNLSRSQV